MSFGCAASLPKSLFIQKTLTRDCNVLDLIPGSEMIRNAWMGISVCLGSQVGKQSGYKGIAVPSTTCCRNITRKVKRRGIDTF